MAATIKPIDGRSIHQIQSGQVIVDLCSVVKELVENSIDSGASIIDVRFKNQGLDLVEVQDNGSGIAPANYASIALKHHTSKLSSYSDIASLETFGFRGEALASLCALSNLTITTCLQADVPKGSRLTFEPTGQLRDTAVVAAQRGTAVAVDRLFHNLPVRRRELERNVKREWHKVIALLNQYACIQTGIKISVSQQPTKGKRLVLFSTKGNPTTRDNIINIFGAKTLSALVPLDMDLELEPSTVSAGEHPISASNKVRIVGHVSRPSPGEGRQTPDRQMFFVNGRPCSLPQLARAFNEVYRSYNYSQSPFILADIQLDTHMYDVNVSPDKRTILLHDQGRLLDRVRSSLTALFDANDHVVPISQVADQRRRTSVEASAKRPQSSPLVGPDTVIGDTNVSDASSSSGDESDHSCNASQESFGSQVRTPASVNVARDKPRKRRRTVHDQGLMSQWLSQDSGKPSSGSSIVPPGRSATVVDAVGPSYRGRSLYPQLAASAAKQHLQFSPEMSPSLPASPQVSDDGTPEITTVPSQGLHQRPSPHCDRNATSPDGVVNEQNAVLQKRQCLDTEEDEGKRPLSPLFMARNRPHLPSDGDRCASEAPHYQSGNGETAASDTHNGYAGLSPASDSESPEDCLDSGFTGVNPRHAARLVPTETLSSSTSALLGSHPRTREAIPSAASPSVKADLDPVLSSEGGASTRCESSRDLQATTADESPLMPVRSSAFSIKRTEPTVSTSRWYRTNEEEIWHGLSRLTSGIAAGGAVLPGERDVEDIASSDAEAKLSLIISRGDFPRMRVVGQFNLGFIIAVRPAHGRESVEERDELFIIDQHASDEKYNFERLQANTTVQSQRLVHAKALQLTALEEEIVMENMSALESNGFKIEVDASGDSPVGSRCQLVALPLSRETTFTMDDLQELIALLGEESAESGHVPRPSRVRKMFAMRACRSSIMIGKALTQHQMSNVLQHMGELDKPWNCPHGRPTMRHLCHLDAWDKGRWKGDVAAVSASVWRSYGRGQEV
ncbi:ATP-binding mismatch repair protein [Purpureocillium takamizusanense]|uniref:DNA mismatch repair protein PMS1 n=1 Tax=Purpureocillium takamizusanense TaxID=2060973 RepID=A0A9Q8QMT0_9HYPO|nr:ATP-binding mismatch repair protein [Purpureocillium takamizusanense]UNI22092.1 ATP-binding mismatch repair protein [Purpureocillium takamizusanense]